MNYYNENILRGVWSQDRAIVNNVILFNKELEQFYKVSFLFYYGTRFKIYLN